MYAQSCSSHTRITLCPIRKVTAQVGGVGYLRDDDFVPKVNTPGSPDSHCVSSLALITYLAHCPSTPKCVWRKDSEDWVTQMVAMAVKSHEDLLNQCC